MTSEELLINKVWWVVCGMLICHNNGLNFVNEEDIYESIGQLSFTKNINLQEIRSILKAAEKGCLWFMPTRSIGDTIIGYKII